MLPRIRIKGATIVTMDPTLGVIESGDILLDDGKIIAIGPRAGSWAVTEIDGRGMIAVPGFINGHIHLWQTALRGLAADWTLDHYFGVLIGQVVKLYDPRDAYIGNLVGALDQINCGVTTLFDWCHIVNTPAHADAAVDALQEFGYSRNLCLWHAHDAFRNDRAASDRRREDAQATARLKRRAGDDGARYSGYRFRAGDGGSGYSICPRPRPPGILSCRLCQARAATAEHAKLGKPGAFGPGHQPGARQLPYTRGVQGNRRQGRQCVDNAGSRNADGAGIPPTEAALAARTQVNIGTDVVTGVSTDIFTQMRFLLQTQRALTNDQFHKRETMPERLTMTAKQALEMVTIKSAECFGMGKRLGSLAPGKEADITLIRKSDINMRAAADPISAVVLHAGVANVDTVIVGGKIVKQNGKLLFRDLPRKLEDLDRSSERLYAGFNAKATAA